MVELRWLIKEVEDVPGDSEPYRGSFLQYRYHEPYHDWKGRPVWSEWIDVPTADEE